MKPEDIHKADQAGTTAADMLPPYLSRMHVNLVKEGFTEHQAFQIILQMVANMGSK